MSFPCATTHLRLRPAVRLALAAILWAHAAGAHSVYLANENHTDYGWNATTDAYDTSMVSELDYYLGRIDATAADPPAEQARFNADCWYYMYLYERKRSPAQFQELIDKIRSGHINVPLNPLVTMYGALPTEAAIRAGYYPGRIERRHGVQFSVGEEMENATIPWGLASLWAGSRARYSWKGICACATSGGYYQQHTTDVFRWIGPDAKELLFKWYEYSGNNRSWGGYAETRDNLTESGIAALIARDTAPARDLPASGAFGYGWDDVNSQTTALESTVAAWNAAHAEMPARVSNIVDYFEALAARKDTLPALRGGWGNDWDLLPATLAQRTALLRRAVEKLRTAEALAAVIQGKGDLTFWPTRQPALEAAWIDYHKYFEHTWTDGGVGLSYVLNNKRTWQQHFVDTVDQFERDAATAFTSLFRTPNEDRFVVFNPLAFTRTDVADLRVDAAGPFIVTDLATGADVPSQVVIADDAAYLRILASNVPSLGYRVYRYSTGTPAERPNAATMTGNRIESNRYRVELGSRGEITSAFDKAASRDMAGGSLNDFGSGASAGLAAENVGPVSATLRRDISGPPDRRVRVTLATGVDWVIVENEIRQNTGATSHYRYQVSLATPQIRFEEVGALARPGLAGQGGDFLPGTRTDYMTLNHFVNLADPLGGYNITLSSRDAFAMRIGNSTNNMFDLPTSEVSVLALGNVAFGGFDDQGGETLFRDDFALQGNAGPYSGPAAMQMGLAHQNPLRAIPLTRNQSGPLAASVESFLSVSPSNVAVAAFKPVEEVERGLLVRLWELAGSDTSVAIDASAFAPSVASEVSLIETDTTSAAPSDGVINASIAANEIKAFRFVPGSPAATPTSTSTSSRTPTSSQTPTATPTITHTSTTTSTATHTPSTTTTPTATPASTATSGTTPAPTVTTAPTASPTAAAAPGDVNGDGRVDADDVIASIAALFAPLPRAGADVNRDGRISAPDVTALISLPGFQ